MDFLEYLVAWIRRQNINFWGLGVLFLTIGITHIVINVYVAATFLAIFLGGGVVILVGIIREYRKKRDA